MAIFKGLIIAFIVIILSNFCYALPAIPDVGPSGCVEAPGYPCHGGTTTSTATKTTVPTTQQTQGTKYEKTNDERTTDDYVPEEEYTDEIYTPEILRGWADAVSKYDKCTDNNLKVALACDARCSKLDDSFLSCLNNCGVTSDVEIKKCLEGLDKDNAKVYEKLYQSFADQGYPINEVRQAFEEDEACQRAIIEGSNDAAYISCTNNREAKLDVLRQNIKSGSKEIVPPESDLEKFKREYGTHNLFKEGGNWHLEGCSGCVLQNDKILTQDPQNVWFSGAGITTGKNTEIKLIEDNATVQKIAFEKGSAHFLYDASKKKKYHIIVKDVTITVIGTDFTIIKDESKNQTIVDVKEGVVSLYSAATGLTNEVSRSQHATIDNDGVVSVSSVRTSSTSKLKSEEKTGVIMFFAIFLFIPIIMYFIVKFETRKKVKVKKYGYFGLAFSVIGLFTCLMAPIGLCFSLIGLFYCNAQRRINPTGVSKVGRIIGIMGTVISVLIYIPLAIYILVA